MWMGHHTHYSHLGLGQYTSQGEYCGPYPASIVLLNILDCLPLVFHLKQRLDDLNHHRYKQIYIYLYARWYPCNVCPLLLCYNPDRGDPAGDQTAESTNDDTPPGGGPSNYPIHLGQTLSSLSETGTGANLS